MEELLKKEYVLKEIIGKGSYGVVYKAESINSKENRFYTPVEKAIKMINIEDDKEHLDFSVFTEASLLQIMDHPNIIKPDEIRMTKDILAIIMPYYEVTLGKLKNKQHDGNFWKNIFYQLLQAGKYMADNNILHRDLKPYNILINNNIPYIIDYGLGIIKLRPDDYMTTTVQSFWYRAPEIFFQHHIYDWRIDLWSLGVIFIEMILGKNIFGQKEERLTLKKILQILNPPLKDIKLLISYYPNISPTSENLSIFLAQSGIKDTSFIDLVNGMLQFLPSNRFSYSQCLSHPWFNSIKFPLHRGLHINKNLIFMPYYPPKKYINTSIIRLKLSAFLSLIISNFTYQKEKYIFNISSFLYTWILFDYLLPNSLVFYHGSFSDFLLNLHIDLLSIFSLVTYINESLYFSLIDLINVVINVQPKLKTKLNLDNLKLRILFFFRKLSFQAYTSFSSSLFSFSSSQLSSILLQFSSFPISHLSSSSSLSLVLSSLSSISSHHLIKKYINDIYSVKYHNLSLVHPF